MAEDTNIAEPHVAQDQGPGPKQAPGIPVLSEQDRQKLDGIVQKMVQNKESDDNIKFVVGDFKNKYGKAAQAAPVAQPVQTIPEHEIQHTSVQDLRHLGEMANAPVRSESTATGGVGGSGASYSYNQEDVDRNKAYKAQYDNKSIELSKEWGTDPEATKKALTDFPDEQDENKLKNFATLGKQNPVIYGQLKNENDIRTKIAKDGPNGVNDANAYNHLQQADNYHELTEYNIPLQKEIMAAHNLGSADLEKYKDAKAPLINTLDPDLNAKYWNSDDKKLGLNISQYAGLETERLFSPNAYQRDLGIIKHARGLDADGEANPIDIKKEPYEYQRGVENTLYNLDKQGRENTARYIAGQKPQIEAQTKDLQAMYQAKINNAKTDQERQQLVQEFNSNPLIQEATKLEQGQDELKYAEVNDKRNYPLNFSDQSERAVRDAMDQTQGTGTNVGKFFGNVLKGAGESADNTMRWIKNTAINIAGSDEQKAFNNAKNIGHQSLTELSAYEPRSYTGIESPFKIPDNLTKEVQTIFNDTGLSDSQKEQKATALIRDNFDQLEVNPKAGQQNLTGKATIYQAANVMGQILGIANQSFLLGGAIGDASKLQQMATAFTPMYMSTQNQMYEQALKNGDEHPLLKSNLDATIISLASLINPDIKVVRGMVGAESAVGKTLAGISDETWNKVLSINKPIVDRAIGVAKATGKQLGLANLQYGLVVPTAEAISHKAIFNEDSNLGDKIKDAVVQTSLTMALPAILHGAWGGMKATDVNPAQKYAIVEAGLHPDLNIELIDGRIKSGEISEIQGHEMKQMVKHAGEILLNSEMVKTDGTPMNEKEVADTVYNMLRVRTLEGKLKNAAGPVKPIIEERIHKLNKDIADLHTSESDKQKAELNQLLHDNLDRIKNKMPTMEGPIKDAIARNEPEEVYKEIASQAQEITKVDGVEKSSRPLTEEIFGKSLVDKAIEISKQKEKPVEKPEDIGIEKKPVSSISVIKPGEFKSPEVVQPTGQFLESRHADTMDDERGKVSGPNDNPLSKDGKRDATDLAKEVEGKGVTKIITSDLERAKETGRIVGEKTGAKVESRPELNTWDIGQFDKTKDSEFKKAQEFFVNNPDAKEFEGKKINESFNEYKNRVIKARTELEKEPATTLVVNHSNNMMLWDAYVKNGHEWNEQAAKDYLAAKTPEPATLTNKNKDNASTVRSDQGQINPTGNEPGNSQNEGSENLQQPSGQETVNASPEQQAGQQPSEAPGQEVDEWPFKEEPFDLPVGIKKAISEAQRAQHLLPPVELKSIGTDSEVLAAGKKAVDDGKINPREVASRVISDNGIYTTDEAGAMQYYAHQLRAAENDYHIQKTEADNILSKDPENTAAFYSKITAEQKLGQLDDDTDALTKANRINSRSWGNLGNIMQIETDPSFSPARVRAVIKDNYGGEIPEKVQEKLDRANAERDKAIADLKAVKERVALQELQKDAAKEKPAKQPKTVAEKKAALKDERAKLIEDLKAAIKKDTSNLSANPFPINTLEAVSKLALNYFKDGVVTIEGLTNKIYDDLKDIIEGLDKKQVRDAISTYQPLRTEAYMKDVEKMEKKGENPSTGIYKASANKGSKFIYEKDTRWIKAKQALVNAEYKIKQEKFKSYQSKESYLQKTAGWANRLMRLSILSGVKVLEKLAAAATIGSATMKIPEEIMNGVWGQVFPKVKAKADLDMGMNVQAIGKYYSQFFNPVEFAKDTRDIIKSGETRLGKELETQHYDHIPILDLPTDLHQVIKGPPKRAMFQYALTKILDAEQKKGIDINHPLVLESARQRAFARAKYEIFQEKNAVSRQFGKWESKWREEANSDNKFTKTAGAAKSFLLHFAFPVSTVPTNIARRVGLSVAGLPIGLTKIAKAYHAGIENLSPDEANFIGKALTKGSLGIALWSAGFFGYKSMGGLYTKFDPNKQREDETLSDELQLMNHSVSKPWQHALPFEVMQLGATFRHIYEKTKEKESDPIAVAKATMGSTGAILEQIPVVETPINAVMATQDPYMAKKLGEDLKRRAEPQLLKDVGIIKPDDKKNEKGTRAPAHR